MTSIGLGLWTKAIVIRHTIEPIHSIGSTNWNHEGESWWNLNENKMEWNGNWICDTQKYRKIAVEGIKIKMVNNAYILHRITVQIIGTDRNHITAVYLSENVKEIQRGIRQGFGETEKKRRQLSTVVIFLFFLSLYLRSLISNIFHASAARTCQRGNSSSIRLFAFKAGGGGRRGKQFSTSLGDHVHVSKAETSMSYV